jgi:hypothetical protein
MIIPQNFTPRPYQLKLLQALDGVKGKPETRKRKTLIVWPRQHGKDTTCFAYMAKEAARKVGNYFYVFPTKEEARRAVWEKTLDDGTRMLDFLPKEVVDGRLNQDMSIRLKNGSTIRVVGLDKNPDSIRGITPQGIIFSEFAFSDFEAYKIVLPALHRHDSWLIINSTPNGRNHFYDMFQGAKKSSEWYVDFKQCLYPERKGYLDTKTPEFYENMVKSGEMLWEDIEREFGCDFSTGTKGSFYLPQIEEAFKDGRIGRYQHDSMLPVDTFWDIGLKDSTAVWFVQRVGNAIILIDYYEDFGKSLPAYTIMLKEKGYRYRTHHLPHDGSKRQHVGMETETVSAQFADALRINEVSGYVTVVSKPHSKIEGIYAVRRRFSRYCFNLDTCKLGISRLELYHKKWDKKRKVFLKEPEHDENSDGADALRLEAIVGDSSNDYFLNKGKSFGLKVKSDYDIFGD